jgi:hypothetical protein
MTFGDMAIEILRRTHDGDDLDPRDLKLVEHAVNSFLSEAGEVAFSELHERANRDGGYVKPWLRGIEHLTRDHEGYVFWKGEVVEHFSFRDAAKEQQAPESLAADCCRLETSGVTPTSANLMRFWKTASDAAAVSS